MQTLMLERQPWGVATVSLNRPEKHNAISDAMIAELSQTADDLAADQSVRVIVLTGNGRTFCAGADISWMKDNIAKQTETRRIHARRLAEMLNKWFRIPKPVIGRVQGNAFGGGVGLVSVCDSVIAAHSAEFALTEVRLGLVPATISPYVVAKVGVSAAKRLFMSAQRINCKAAVSLGLVQTAAADEELDDFVRDEAEIYRNCAPGAVAQAKELAISLGLRIDDQLIEMTADQLVKCLQRREAAEGIQAFFESRPPAWALDSNKHPNKA